MEFIIKFKEEELKTVLAGLQELPFKVVSPVINSVLQQAQNQPKEEVKEDPKELVETPKKAKK